MVPSPRKCAPTASFDQTWDDNDAAFFDPGSLPVARIPRGWERKQEVKRTEGGPEKKIWRRFNLRSRAADQPAEEQEEEHDARSRAVKKQQHMSPKAMEKTSSNLNGKKRAFKATRWDRRKSVLPRKKISHAESALVDAGEDTNISDDGRDATNGDLDDESIIMVDSGIEAQAEPLITLIPEGNRRRETFTFSVEAESADEALNYENVEGLHDHNAEHSEIDAHAEDATIVRLFKSPAKQALFSATDSDEVLQYPKLPQSEHEVEVATHTESVAVSSTTLVQEKNEGTLEWEETETEKQVVEDGVEQTEMDINETTEQETEPVAENIPSISDNTISHAEPRGESSNLTYPALPAVASPMIATEPVITSAEPDANFAEENAEMSDSLLEVDVAQDEEGEEMALDDSQDRTTEEEEGEEFTEASLQLNILRDYQDTLRRIHPRLDEPQDGLPSVALRPLDSDDQPLHEQETATPAPLESKVDDITDGLTLSFTPAKAPIAEPTLRKLHSPPLLEQPATDDANMTIALDDDTALLKDFLNRAAASKAEKAAVMTHRRESLQNRRDSDVVRHALASPRKVLEEKDPNSSSKHDNEMTLDLSQNLTLDMDNNTLASPTPEQADGEETSEEKSARGSRRSSRTKKSRLPAASGPAQAQAQAQTPKIAIRRADGTEHVTLKKSGAQELAALTRNNTRKNKQGAFGVTVRLMKLAMDAASLPTIDDSTKELIVGKNIRWDEQLAYYQENPETVAEAESAATPDELGMPEPVSTPSAKPKSKVSKSSTPKIRRVRGLGTTNGTPGKGLLAPASLLPDEIQGQKEAVNAPPQQISKPKASKIKKMTVAPTPASAPAAPSESKLPSLDIAPVGVQPTKERKSRLAAPKKVMLPQPVVAMPSEGKENTQRTGIGGATPKKGIPAPKVVVPATVGMESGLPRRRGRKF